MKVTFCLPVPNYVHCPSYCTFHLSASWLTTPFCLIVIRSGQTQICLHFCVFADLTLRHFVDTIGEDATVMKKMWMGRTQCVTDVKFCVVKNVYPQQNLPTLLAHSPLSKQYLISPPPTPPSILPTLISLTSSLGAQLLSQYVIVGTLTVNHQCV